MKSAEAMPTQEDRKDPLDAQQPAQEKTDLATERQEEKLEAIKNLRKKAGEFRGAASDYSENKKKRESLKAKWQEFNGRKGVIKNEKDSLAKESLIQENKNLYEQLKAEYKELTGKELREDVREAATAKGVKFESASAYKARLQERADLALETEKPKIKKEIQEQACQNAIEQRWSKLSDKEKKKYKNEAGVIDKKEYEKELEKKRSMVSEMLEEKHGIKLSKEVFYRMIENGYKPEKIKGRILSKEDGVILRTVYGGLFGGVGGLVTFGPFGGIVGTITGGSFGGFLADRLLPHRLSGGVKCPSVKEGGKNTFSEDDFKDLVMKMGQDAKQSLDEKFQQKLQEIAQIKQQEVNEKVAKAIERFNQIKNEAANSLIAKAVEIKPLKKKGAEPGAGEILKRAETLDDLKERLTVDEKKSLRSAEKIISDLFNKEKNNKNLKERLEKSLGAEKTDKNKNPLYKIENVKLRDDIRRCLSVEIRKKFERRNVAGILLNLKQRGVRMTADVYYGLKEEGYSPEQAVMEMGLHRDKKIKIPKNGEVVYLTKEQFAQIKEKYKGQAKRQKEVNATDGGEKPKEPEISSPEMQTVGDMGSPETHTVPDMPDIGKGQEAEPVEDQGK